MTRLETLEKHLQNVKHSIHEITELGCMNEILDAMEEYAIYKLQKGSEDIAIYSYEQGFQTAIDCLVKAKESITKTVKK